MRITAELLSRAEIRTNPIQDRELVLRELGILAIENMGTVPSTDFVSIDLSNNRIKVLENFARFPLVRHLYCAGNLIERIDKRNLRSNLPNLLSMTLSDCQISSLAEVASLAQACPKLEHLSLVGNPVTRRQHYRLYLINQLPQLKTLDYSKVKSSDRARADRLARSAAGADLESDVRHESNRTFIHDRQRLENDHQHPSVATDPFTKEEKEKIRSCLISASSAKEIEEIEMAVKRGVLPPAVKRKRQDGDHTLPPSNGLGQMLIEDNKDEAADNKRPRIETLDDS